MSQNTPIKVTRWQRWRIVFYGFVGIVVFLLLGWGYLNYREQQEWALIDQMLAEQDRKHPHWRWHEFQPKPLQPGQVNGALKFIQVGKQLTNEMLTVLEIPEEDELHFPMMTKEWLTTIERESKRRSYQLIWERSKHLEKALPGLVEIVPGCPPLNGQRPSAESIWGEAKHNEPPLIQDERSYNLQARWLTLITAHYINEGKGNEAIQAWRALLASAIADAPGKMSISRRSVRYYKAYHLVYQLLARTEPDEASLLELQKSITQWRSYVFTLDEVYMDRAWCVQLLLEMKEKAKSLPLTGLHQLYVKPPQWLPEKWHDLASSLGIGSPSLASMYRMEVQTHLRMMDYLEERLKSGESVALHVSDLLDDENAMPGRHFRMYFKPRWTKLLADTATLPQDLHCMEALVAAERYRLKHGDFPRRWSDLVPVLLQEVPKEAGKPYILKHDPGGLVIYRIGYREKDLGGKVLRKYNPESNETDSEIDDGLMIFYPKYRRQPPPPVKPKAKSEE